MRARLRLALPALCWAPAWAQLPGEPAPLRVGFDASSLPTMYALEHGVAAGIYPAIVRRAFALMGESVQLHAEPFKRLIAGLMTGQQGAGAVVRNPERLAVADYSADYFTEHLHLYQLAGSNAASGIEGLRGLRVGVLRGWSYGEAFDKARAAQWFLAEEVETDAKNFAKLRRSRLDAVVATEMAGRMLLAEPSLAGITAQPRPLISIGIALAVPKRLQASALLQRFDDSIARMRREHQIDSLVTQELAQARQMLKLE